MAPKKAKDPNAPKRPMSAFFLWMQVHREQVKKPGMSVSDVVSNSLALLLHPVIIGVVSGKGLRRRVGEGDGQEPLGADGSGELIYCTLLLISE